MMGQQLVNIANSKHIQFALLLLVSWCVMVTTHEAGHILAGCACGGELVDYELRPWKLPHSYFNPDPHPLITVWAGPVLGVLLPISVALIVRKQVMWLIADFCLIANGSYLAAAWFSGDRLLDTQRLIDAGAPAWSIATYIVATCLIGYLRFRNSCMRYLSSSSDAVSKCR